MTVGFALDDAAWASPWRRRAVGEKLLLAGGLGAVGLAVPVWPGSALVAGTALGLLLGPARVAARVLVRSLSAPLGFVTVGALSVLVSVRWEGRVVLAVTTETREAMLSVLGHGVTGTLAVMVIAATTPMADLLAGFRRLRVPDACIDVAGLVYRLVMVLLSTLRQTREAQAARLGYRDRRSSLRSAAGLSASLLVRSWDRARRLEEGLAARGYTGSLPSLEPPRRVSAVFVVATVVGLAALTAVSLVAGGS